MTLSIALLVALTISSDRIDRFMSLPDWMPKSLSGEHTFGSTDHTNTHRTAKETLAAVESVLEAYHERVFFLSEADNANMTGPWDDKTFGPYPSNASNLQSLWITNACENPAETSLNARVFVYAPATNRDPNVERPVPDSRRLHEFGSILKVRDKIKDLVKNDYQAFPIVYKGEKWGSTNRCALLGSSWIGNPDAPTATGWSASYPPGNLKPGDHCVAFAGTYYDIPFAEVWEEPKLGFGFVQKTFSDIDSGFGAYRYRLLDKPSYDSERGDLHKWEAEDYWSTASSTSTVNTAILTRFPKTYFYYDDKSGLYTDEKDGLVYGMTNQTRRLIPDDSVTYRTTNYIMFVEERDLGEMSLRDYPPTPDIIYLEKQGSRSKGLTSERFVVRVDRSNRKIEFQYTFPDEDGILPGVDFHECTVNVESHYMYSLIPEEYLDTDKYRIKLKPDSQLPSGAYEWDDALEGYRWKYDTPSIYLSLTVEKYVCETNGILQAMSTLATESRVLSMIDTSYEIPVYTGGTANVATGAWRRYRNRIPSKAYAVPVVITDYFNPSGLAPISPVNLDDIEMPKVNNFSNEYYELPLRPHPSHTDRRIYECFSGVGGEIEIGFAPDTDEPFERTVLTAAQLKAYLREYGSPPTYVRLRAGTVESRTLAVYVEGWLSYGVGGGSWNIIVESYDNFDELSNGKLKCEMYFGSSLYAEYCRAKVPDRAFIQRNIAPVGPGNLARSGGVIGQSDVLFFDEMLVLRGHDDWTTSISPYDTICVLPTERYSNDSWYHPKEDLSDEPYDVFPRVRLGKSTIQTGRDVPGVIASYLSAFSEEAHGRLMQELNVTSFEDARYVLPSLFPLSKFYPDFKCEQCRVEQVITYPLGDSFSIVTRGDDFTIHVGGPDGTVVKDEDSLVKAVYFAYPVVEFGPNMIPSYLRPRAEIWGESRPVILTRWNWKALKSN